MPLLRLRNRHLMSILEVLAAPYSVLYRVLPQAVAVVDADCRLVGTILERELLRYLFRGRSS
jgi:hypothetical protein